MISLRCSLSVVYVRGPDIMIIYKMFILRDSRITLGGYTQ